MGDCGDERIKRKEDDTHPSPAHSQLFPLEDIAACGVNDVEGRDEVSLQHGGHRRLSVAPKTTLVMNEPIWARQLPSVSTRCRLQTPHLSHSLGAKFGQLIDLLSARLTLPRSLRALAQKTPPRLPQIPDNGEVLRCFSPPSLPLSLSFLRVDKKRLHQVCHVGWGLTNGGGGGALAPCNSRVCAGCV